MKTVFFEYLVNVICVIILVLILFYLVVVPIINAINAVEDPIEKGLRILSMSIFVSAVWLSTFHPRKS